MLPVSPRVPTSQNGRYSLQGTLKGHHGAILCISAADDSKVVSGGECLSCNASQNNWADYRSGWHMSLASSSNATDNKSSWCRWERSYNCSHLNLAGRWTAWWISLWDPKWVSCLLEALKGETFISEGLSCGHIIIYWQSRMRHSRKCILCWFQIQVKSLDLHMKPHWTISSCVTKIQWFRCIQ